MRSRPWIAGLALSGLLVCVGCVSERRPEAGGGRGRRPEAGGVQAAQPGGGRPTRRPTTSAGSAPTPAAQDRRFQADLQETLRQLQDTTRVLSNRLGDSHRAPGRRRQGRRRQPRRPWPRRGSRAAGRGGQGLLAPPSWTTTGATTPWPPRASTCSSRHNPQSPQRADALFYLGLSYYNQKRPDKATPVFGADHARLLQLLPVPPGQAQARPVPVRMGLKPAAITAFKEITERLPRLAGGPHRAAGTGRPGVLNRRHVRGIQWGVSHCVRRACHVCIHRFRNGRPGGPGPGGPAALRRIHPGAGGRDLPGRRPWRRRMPASPGPHGGGGDRAWG